jgi:hypothetical protein
VTEKLLVLTALALMPIADFAQARVGDPPSAAGREESEGTQAGANSASMEIRFATAPLHSSSTV